MRKSGILMHISSLPSKYGIGKMGKSAYDFVDFLVSAGVVLDPKDFTGELKSLH